MMLKRHLSDQITERALRVVPALVGDSWGGARVPVWVETIPFPPPQGDDWDSPRPVVPLDGHVIAELYAKTPFELAVEPLLLDLLNQPLVLPAPWSGRAILAGWNEGLTPDGNLSVARLRFAVKGVLMLGCPE
jgi:hypothetical protein